MAIPSPIPGQPPIFSKFVEYDTLQAAVDAAHANGEADDLEGEALEPSDVVEPDNAADEREPSEMEQLLAANEQLRLKVELLEAEVESSKRYRALNPGWYATQHAMKTQWCKRNFGKVRTPPEEVKLFFTPEDAIEVLRKCKKALWKDSGLLGKETWYHFGVPEPTATHQIPLICLEDPCSTGKRPMFIFALP